MTNEKRFQYSLRMPEDLRNLIREAAGYEQLTVAGWLKKTLNHQALNTISTYSKLTSFCNTKMNEGDASLVESCDTDKAA